MSEASSESSKNVFLQIYNRHETAKSSQDIDISFATDTAALHE